jgi:protein-L-isoaspartate(D-aspartate) O-methyltransferase
MSFDELRETLAVDLKHRQIIISEKVYLAMKKVPRHLFVPEEIQHRAYMDSPQEIGKGQTISAPHMNAMMCEYLDLREGLKILEIGAGSGYQAALIAEIVGKTGKVFTIERIPDLVENSRKILDKLNYTNITVIVGDGTEGYEKEAPFDRILVTAAGPEIPRPLLTQLSPNDGILCIPVGKIHWDQDLYVIRRTKDKYTKQKICKVVFVPLMGKFGFKD